MKKVLITGGTSGIGKACVDKFFNEGWNIILIGRDSDKLNSLVQSYEGADRFQTYLCDFLNIQETEEIFLQISKENSEIHALINSAGICQKNTLENISIEEWNSIYQVNVTVPFVAIKNTLSSLEKAGGSIVNISSIAGRLRSISLGAHYSSTKAALIGLTRHLAAELGPKGIRVNATCPSQTKTPMLDQALEQAAQDQLAKGIPLKRISAPEEQASAVYFLCQEDASYINGAILDVNGGQL